MNRIECCVLSIFKCEQSFNIMYVNYYFSLWGILILYPLTSNFWRYSIGMDENIFRKTNLKCTLVCTFMPCLSFHAMNVSVCLVCVTAHTQYRQENFSPTKWIKVFKWIFDIIILKKRQNVPTWQLICEVWYFHFP